MSAFSLQDFFTETGLSLQKLATYLQVAESYLQSAMAGTTRLTRRDETACRKLRRRLTAWKQLELPFAEPPATFLRTHTREQARARAKLAHPSSSRRRPSPRSAPMKPGRHTSAAKPAKRAKKDS